MTMTLTQRSCGIEFCKVYLDGTEPDESLPDFVAQKREGGTVIELLPVGGFHWSQEMKDHAYDCAEAAFAAYERDGLSYRSGWQASMEHEDPEVDE